MAKRNDILNAYYTKTYPFRDSNSFQKRLSNWFKRHNFFKKMDKEIDCLELADKVLTKIRPNGTIDRDPFLKRGRKALVNAVTFFLYYEHEPNDFDFVRVTNLLKSAKEQKQLGSFYTDLHYMYYEDGKEVPNHTGRTEYDAFKAMGSNQAAYMIIDDVLQNFNTPAKCKCVFAEAVKEVRSIK